jgi:D-tyrosyl-tRNA(Tyr) deacylase
MIGHRHLGCLEAARLKSLSPRLLARLVFHGGKANARRPGVDGSGFRPYCEFPYFSPDEDAGSMRAVLQRVSRAKVTVAGQVTGEIGKGLLVLLGVSRTDTEEHVRWMADKVAGIRIFEDADGKMNVDLAAVGGSALVVSQFTLYGNCEKGRRPSFIDAAPPEQAEPLYLKFVEALKALGVPVQTGVFRAEMTVELVNDGPVTVIVERP